MVIYQTGEYLSIIAFFILKYFQLMNYSFIKKYIFQLSFMKHQS